MKEGLSARHTSNLSSPFSRYHLPTTPFRTWCYLVIVSSMCFLLCSFLLHFAIPSRGQAQHRNTYWRRYDAVSGGRKTDRGRAFALARTTAIKRRRYKGTRT